MFTILFNMNEWVKVTQLCLTLCNPMDSTVHRILQARMLEWAPFPSPGDLPDPGIKPRSRTLQEDSLQIDPQGKPLNMNKNGYFDLSTVNSALPRWWLSGFFCLFCFSTMPIPFVYSFTPQTFNSLFATWIYRSKLQRKNRHFLILQNACMKYNTNPSINIQTSLAEVLWKILKINITV